MSSAAIAATRQSRDPPSLALGLSNPTACPRNRRSAVSGCPLGSPGAIAAPSGCCTCCTGHRPGHTGRWPCPPFFRLAAAEQGAGDIFSVTRGCGDETRRPGRQREPDASPHHPQTISPWIPDRGSVVPRPVPAGSRPQALTDRPERSGKTLPCGKQTGLEFIRPPECDRSPIAITLLLQKHPVPYMEMRIVRQPVCRLLRKSNRFFEVSLRIQNPADLILFLNACSLRGRLS